MHGEMIILKVSGDVYRCTVDKPPSLEALQGAVNGHIEEVPYFRTYEGVTCVAFCNEEGKLRGLTYNAHATALWHAQHATNDMLVGDVVVITGDQDLLDEI